MHTTMTFVREGEHMWFAGMINAAQDRGMEVQLCMASVRVVQEQNKITKKNKQKTKNKKNDIDI